MRRASVPYQDLHNPKELTVFSSIIILWQDENRLREALLFANACGALTVTERGAIPALPTKEAALKLLHTVAAL